MQILVEKHQHSQNEIGTTKHCPVNNITYVTYISHITCKNIIYLANHHHIIIVYYIMHLEWNLP